MRLIGILFIASLKMFFRQREAIVWAFLLPLFLVGVFSLVRFEGENKVRVGIVQEVHPTELTMPLRDSILASPYLAVSEGLFDSLMIKLKVGDLDLVAVLDQDGRLQPRAYLNEERLDDAKLGVLVIQGILDDVTFRILPPDSRITVDAEYVPSRSLSYLDFLLPGVISMSIMQMGVFGVAFSFVSLKKRGILRRLSVTPMRPRDFILTQVATRLIVVVIQISVMVVVGLLLLDFSFEGDLPAMFVAGVLGAIVFLAIGFALAGVSKSEDQVAPLANLVSVPMMLLCGVFFSRSSLPGFVETVTEFLPLTYLVDAMRSIALHNASLPDVGPQLLGLGVWCVLSCGLAIKLFRWE
jgi:ABC-2 type transport system permease protein